MGKVKKLLSAAGIVTFWLTGYMAGSAHLIPKLDDYFNRVKESGKKSLSYANNVKDALSFDDIDVVDWLGNDTDESESFENVSDISLDNKTVRFYSFEEALELLENKTKDPLEGYTKILPYVLEASLDRYFKDHNKNNISEEELKSLEKNITRYIKRREKEYGVLYSFPKEYPSFYPKTLPKDYFEERRQIIDRWNKMEEYAEICFVKYCSKTGCDTNKNYGLVVDVPFIPEIVDEKFGSKESVVPVGNRSMIVMEDAERFYKNRDVVPFPVYKLGYLKECKMANEIAKGLVDYNCYYKTNLINPSKRCIPRIENSFRNVFVKSVNRSKDNYLLRQSDFYSSLAYKIEQELTWDEVESFVKGE